MRFREIKQIDEVIGLAGILYLLLLSIIGFWLINSLAMNVEKSITSTTSSKPLPQSYDLDTATKALKR